MKLMDLCAGDKIQNRRIDISTHDLDGEHFLVYGELMDRRQVTTWSVDESPREAGPVHHMKICMKVDFNTLEISEIEVELPQVPHEECPEMNQTLDRIVGMTLTPGFSAEVKKRVGGRKGCVHLNTLLLAMAPAALQGYWVKKDRNPGKRDISAGHLNQYLIDSCRVWRREGPLVEKVTRAAGIELPE